MNEPLGSRFKRAWNVFLNKDPVEYTRFNEYGDSFSYRPDRPKLSKGVEKSIINSVFNRIALDVAAIDLRHVRLDENGRYLEEIDSELNRCLSFKANLDQTSRAIVQDMVLSMFDEGCIAIVPVETIGNPYETGSYDICSLRVGKILEWRPSCIKTSLYNERTGRREEKWIPKSIAAIVENPLYSVMNEPNSTLKRLIRKLNLLDAVDEQSSSGKLDLIIELPYSIKTDARRKQAEERKKDIEQQLSGSKYGIAYIDGTERVTQLNRPAENNLMKQIEYLTSMLYSQLGMTTGILDGTADDKTMLNYYNRIVEPIISAIVDSMKCTFLTKTAITQRQSIVYFRDPFKLIPVNDLAEIVDKFTRNEIMSSNEFRQIVGRKPSTDPKADELINKNLNHPAEENPTGQENSNEGGKIQNGL